MSVTMGCEVHSIGMIRGRVGEETGLVYPTDYGQEGQMQSVKSNM